MGSPALVTSEDVASLQPSLHSPGCPSPYVGYQYHQPLYYQQPMAYPMPAGQAQTRTILSLGNALELKGTFVTAAAGSGATGLPARTISGDFLIQQNGLLDLSTS